jgi:benzoyl-CoA reductase/2-hydroxyglutaryl-CoA dehydratase subunit BcrC/BadD/HgdB
MNQPPARISLEQWDLRYEQLLGEGIAQPTYGGPLRRHVADGDYRLLRLSFDNSPASLRLWNFLLTEESRLLAARDAGRRIVGTMKDLGTAAVMAYSLPETIAFYPDGAWWVPCIMEQSTCDLQVADSLGIDDSFCPVRAMLGALVTGGHFPKPDLLVCSVGATCDDFSAIAQRLSGLGFPIHWWEIPPRRKPSAGETTVLLPGGFEAPACQVAFVRGQLQQVREALQAMAGRSLTDDMLAVGIRIANQVRRLLEEIRRFAFTAAICPLPSLEVLIAEMLAIHYCSDRNETLQVLQGLLAEVRRRVDAAQGIGPADAARIFWVNPVADLRAMNLLEECGGRLCGSDFMFCHALDEIPEDLEPLEALARMALADPMVGPSADRADRVCRDIVRFRAEAVVISRIPGASHCAWEGAIMAEIIESRLHLPVVRIEVPPLTDALLPALRTRLEALVEMAQSGRQVP